jgi:uncharacterized protein
MIRKPVPRIDAINAPFWNACNEDRVLIQRCTAPDCRKFVYYPRVCCPHCHKGDLEWTEVSGQGRIATYTIIHRPHHDGFLDEVPYVFAAVTLDEGPIIYGRVVGEVAGNEPLIGQSVEPVFVQHTPDQKLLSFRLSAQTR